MSTITARERETRKTNQWQLRDGGRVLCAPDAWEQLRDALLNLPKSAHTPNMIVDLVSPQGDTLSLGIAGPSDKDNPSLRQPLACMNYVDASLNPPYLTVVGDPALTYETGGVVVFKYEGTWTEILQRNCVPVERMLEAAKYFFETGTLPDWIEWEEV